MDYASTRSPLEVSQIMIDHAVAKHKVRYEQMLFKAFMAGVYLSVGGFLNATFQGGATGLNAENPGLVRIVGAFIFPVGLVMIVLNGAELLTSNMMSMVMGAAKGAIPWWSVAVNWIIVFFGNLAGSLFFDALLVKYTGLFDTEAYMSYLDKAVTAKAVTPMWHQIFLRGIGCNWLVCVAIWQAAASRETISKIYAIWIPIWTFVALNYDHVVANMFTIPTGLLLDAVPGLTTAGYIRKSLIASLIGNIIGAQFVGLPMLWYYWSELSGGSFEREAMELSMRQQQQQQAGGRGAGNNAAANDVEGMGGESAMEKGKAGYVAPGLLHQQGSSSPNGKEKGDAASDRTR